MIRYTCAALGLLWGMGCGAAAPHAYAPPAVVGLPPGVADDGRPIDEYRVEILSGVIGVDKLASRMDAQPRMALALATEDFLLECLQRGRLDVAEYLAKQWVVISPGLLARWISSPPAKVTEQRLLQVLQLLASYAEDPAQARPELAGLVTRDWPHAVAHVLERFPGTAAQLDQMDEETGARLANRAPSRAMREVLLAHGGRLSTADEMAYAARQWQLKQAQLEQERREIEAEEREWQREREERERAEAELYRLEQAQRDAEAAVRNAESERARIATWNAINKGLDDIQQFAREQNEATLAAARQSYERQQQARAEREALAQREREQRLEAERRQYEQRLADARRRAAAAESAPRPRAGSDVSAIPRPGTTVIQNPFAGAMEAVGAPKPAPPPAAAGYGKGPAAAKPSAGTNGPPPAPPAAAASGGAAPAPAAGTAPAEPKPTVEIVETEWFDTTPMDMWYGAKTAEGLARDRRSIRASELCTQLGAIFYPREYVHEGHLHCDRRLSSWDKSEQFLCVYRQARAKCRKPVR